MSPTRPSASCGATGEKVGAATGEKNGPVRETAGGACGNEDSGLITRVLLALAELEALV